MSGGFYTVEPMDTNAVQEDKRVVTIELPASVFAKLKARAKENQRSLSGEIRYVLITNAEGESNGSV